MGRSKDSSSEGPRRRCSDTGKNQNKTDFIPVRETKIKASEIPEGTEEYWERSEGIERHTMTPRDKQNTLQLPWHWSLVEEGTPKA